MLPRPERELVHVRVRKDLLRQVDHLAVERDAYRAETFEFLITLALKHLQQQASFDLPSGLSAIQFGQQKTSPAVS